MKTNKLKQKFAFTLAEVLITLGIIGVVAAMTIPVLMQKYQKNIVETRLEAFYSTINQAIKLSEIDNGDKKTWDAIPTATAANHTALTDWWNKYLEPYLKYVKVDYTSTSGTLVCYLNNGSLFTLSLNSILFFPKANDFNMANPADYKVNSGKTNFTFFFKPTSTTNSEYYFDKGVEPYKHSWDGTENMLRTSTTIGCQETVSNERAYCAALIQTNGWKIPDNYPFFN